MNLKDKVALVTGGASGLGQATVEAYVNLGAKVVILDINEDKANEIINNLGKENVMFISTDIMKEEPVVEAINLIKEKYRGIRPAFGYPACPNHEEKEKLFDILEAEKIEMRLTENYSMTPAASVSGLYFANKNARYFSV